MVDCRFRFYFGLVWFGCEQIKIAQRLEEFYGENVSVGFRSKIDWISRIGFSFFRSLQV